MKIRALTLENIRKFGGKRVSIDQIGDGITVISEANEFGKSTFFDAIHAVVYEKHTATGKTIQSLRPHAGGGLRISLEVEVDGSRFAIEKRFLTKKAASVTDLGRASVIARDGEAEDWITRHIGAADQGPAGLLWVRQGVLGLTPADGKKAELDRLAEARRDLLSSVAGEIEQVTGGRTMDRILKRCQDDLDLLATGSRLSPKGAWKEAVDEAKTLAAELDVLERNCADLSEALTERRQAEAELQRLDDPAEKARRDADLRAARTAAQAAESHAQKIAAARGEADLAGMRQTDATRQRDALVAAIADADAAARALAAAQTRQDAAQQALHAARDGEAALRHTLTEAEAATKALRAETAQAQRSARARHAQDEAKRLETLLKQLRSHIDAAAESKARIDENPATAKALETLEQAAAETARLRSAAAASAVRMTVDYAGNARIALDGLPLADGQPVTLEDGAEVEMPGLGRLRFDLPEAAAADEVETAFAEALAAEAVALAACGADTLAEARDRAWQRRDDVNAATLAEQMQRSLAPAGIAEPERALAEARQVLKGVSDSPARAPEQIAPELEAAETQEAEIRGRLLAASEKVSQARADAATADTVLAAARDAQAKAEAQAGPAETRSARHDRLTAAAQTATAEAAACAQVLAGLQADAPDPATAAANLKRAQAASDNASLRRVQLLEKRAGLSASIATRADEGIEERRDEVAGRLRSITARADRFDAEVKALVRLRDTLEAARADAREAYFEPVQDELRPLLHILHADAAIDWEPDSITPGALRRGGETEAFETLSGGTQEQIAILTRLAFARLFARRGQHLPIILDDALVYSDDDRIVKMFTALNRVALDQQIIVFSCRQLAFAGLGGDRPAIRLEEAS